MTRFETLSIGKLGQAYQGREFPKRFAAIYPY